jgi:hypothetical protein
VGLDCFTELRPLFAARKGDGCMRDPDHHIRHPRGHLGDRVSAKRTSGCVWRDDQFGRGQNTLLGWSDPRFTLGTEPCAKVGSLQPNKKILSVRAARIWAKQVKRVGITYFSFVFTIFFSL